uniref:Nicotinamide N-methyltransferase n=1 Tax=Leptobrachium leishanense TaxID=445787 RepID=A0A8C5R7E1_9ANUR
MTSVPLKDYHDEEHDGRVLIQTYVGADKTDTKLEFMHYPMQFIYKIFSSGLVKGSTVMNFCIGPTIAQHMILADFFDEIYLFDSSDANLQEVTRWLNGDDGALDWSHSAMFACELKNERAQWKEQQEKVRRAIKQVLKFDITTDEPLGSAALLPVDCVFTAFYLEVSKDFHSYLRNLKKISSLLKVGGHLVLIFTSDPSLNQHKFGVLKLSEQSVKKALQDAGCNITLWETYESKLNSHLLDHEYLVSAVACKDRHA